jgi:hypothetical protein
VRIPKQQPELLGHRVGEKSRLACGCVGLIYDQV